MKKIQMLALIGGVMLVSSAASASSAMVSGPDGHLWYAAGDLYRVNGDGSTTKFAAGGGAYDLTNGPNGNLWLTSRAGAGAVGRLNGDGSITWYTAGVVTGFSANRNPTGIVLGPDGNIWFTENTNPGAVARLNSNGTVTEYVGGVTSGFSANRGPMGITSGPDGNIWFTEFGDSTTPTAVARLNGNGTVTQFVAGTATGFSTTAGYGATEITTGPDGNLWFTVNGGNVAPGALGRVNSNATITLFIAGQTPGFTANRWPVGVVAGPDGNLWFTERGGFVGIGAIARLNGNGSVTEYQAGSTTGMQAHSQPSSVASGPDGHIWFREEHFPAAACRLNGDATVTQFATPP